MAKTIKTMLIERFPNRTAMLATIHETRGEGGTVMWYRDGEERIPDDMKTIHGSLDLRGYGHALPAGLTTVGGSLYLRGYGHALSAGLTTVGGSLYLRGYEFILPDALKNRDTRKKFMDPKKATKKKPPKATKKSTRKKVSK